MTEELAAVARDVAKAPKRAGIITRPLGWFHWFAISAFAATAIFYSAILANYGAFMGYWLAACFYFRCTQGGFEK